jgi:opacity protein-like surface antigen
VGFEGDISGVSSVKNKVSAFGEYFHSLNGGQLENYQGSESLFTRNQLDWLSTLRGRVGHAVGPQGRLLGYLTGGIAVAHVKNSSVGSFVNDGGLNWCDACYFDKGLGSDLFQFGYVLGAGAEYAVSDRVSLGLEYLFVGLSGQSSNLLRFNGDDGRSFDVEHNVGFDNVQLLRAKLNVSFGD